VLVFTLFISGCEIENDNRIGLGMSVEFFASINCIKSTVEESPGIHSLYLSDSTFSFTLEHYNVMLIIQTQSEQKTSFKLDIDGQHIDEDNGVFYRKADLFAKDFKKRLVAKCSAGNGL
jgi:hypothetical protein